MKKQVVKRYLPLITIFLVYAAYVSYGLCTGQFAPKHLFLFPLAALGFFLPVWFFVHLILNLFIDIYEEEDLNWLIISIDIVICGILAAITFF